jgi:hypothetical protein
MSDFPLMQIGRCATQPLALSVKRTFKRSCIVGMPPELPLTQEEEYPNEIRLV